MEKTGLREPIPPKHAKMPRFHRQNIKKGLDQVLMIRKWMRMFGDTLCLQGLRWNGPPSRRTRGAVCSQRHTFMRVAQLKSCFMVARLGSITLAAKCRMPGGGAFSVTRRRAHHGRADAQRHRHERGAGAGAPPCRRAGRGRGAGPVDAGGKRAGHHRSLSGRTGCRWPAWRRSCGCLCGCSLGGFSRRNARGPARRALAPWHPARRPDGAPPAARGLGSLGLDWSAPVRPPS